MLASLRPHGMAARRHPPTTQTQLQAHTFTNTAGWSTIYPIVLEASDNVLVLYGLQFGDTAGMADAPEMQEWSTMIAEDIVDPDRRIIDPHHHLWPEGGALPYGLDALHYDTGSGHNVVGTVFVQCGAAHHTDGPEHLKPVGETEFVSAQAAASASRDGSATIAGIVAHANLRLGDQLDEVLDAHAAAGGDLFKGIRDSGALDSDPESLTIPGSATAGLYAMDDFRAGVARLGERGLTFDTWHYHHQNADFAALAAAVPGTTMVLDHFGTPLGVGRFAGKRDEIFEAWKDDIAAIAKNQNVVAKIGGLAMPDNGFGWHDADTPLTSDQFVEEQGRYFHHTIECFGADRCMFESNFPVDRFSLSYAVLWNGFKKIAADYSDAEQTAMFSGTAERVYSLDI